MFLCSSVVDCGIWRVYFEQKNSIKVPNYTKNYEIVITLVVLDALACQESMKMLNFFYIVIFSNILVTISVAAKFSPKEPRPEHRAGALKWH